MIGILPCQRAFTYLENLISMYHMSCACKIANHASRCDIRSHVTWIIWVQSHDTLQILGPSCITQKPFATLFIATNQSFVIQNQT